MSEFDYDLFVIGAGSGGVRAARMAASLGARVAVAEDRYLGGTCVNVGCVPKKLFSYAAHVHEEVDDAAGFGWSIGTPAFDWATLRANKDREIERLNGIYGRLLENAGATLFNARAVLTGPQSVQVDGREVSAERILVATGGWPSVPDLPGKEHIITSNEAFHLDALPRRAVVVGGGYIAVEFASIYNGLGVETTQIYRGPLFLRGFDDDVRQHLAAEMQRKGVDVRFDTQVEAISKTADSYTLTLSGGGQLETDLVMYATGRVPNSAGLGLEEAGVELDSNGAIMVDEHFQTCVPSIYAIGDVIDRVQLTPVALAEGMRLAHALYGKGGRAVDYELIPTAVFSHPNIGTVGLTEAEARERYMDVVVYRSSFTPLKGTLSGNPEKTLMKLIVEGSSDRVVGVHMVGPDAGETIQGIAIALKAGATKAVFDSTIGIHPTAAEEFVTMREPVAD